MLPAPRTCCRGATTCFNLHRFAPKVRRAAVTMTSHPVYPLPFQWSQFGTVQSRAADRTFVKTHAVTAEGIRATHDSLSDAAADPLTRKRRGSGESELP